MNSNQTIFLFQNVECDFISYEYIRLYMILPVQFFFALPSNVLTLIYSAMFEIEKLIIWKIQQIE